jgi:hypothetical protein
MIRIFRFIRAILRFIIRGEIVSNEIKSSRMEKCKTCNHNIYNECNLCGCDIDWKTSMSTEECPKKLWKRYV